MAGVGFKGAFGSAMVCSADRQLAHLGLLDDAAPLFREGASVPGVGVRGERGEGLAPLARFHVLNLKVINPRLGFVSPSQPSPVECLNITGIFSGRLRGRAPAPLVQHFNADGPHHSRLAVRKLACCPRRQRSRTTDVAALDVFNPHSLCPPLSTCRKVAPETRLAIAEPLFDVCNLLCGDLGRVR
jgi:hypothetical protein